MTVTIEQLLQWADNEQRARLLSAIAGFPTRKKAAETMNQLAAQFIATHQDNEAQGE